MDRIERAEVIRQITELNLLRDAHPEHADLIFHRVNALIDLLEADDDHRVLSGLPADLG